MGSGVPAAGCGCGRLRLPATPRRRGRLPDERAYDHRVCCRGPRPHRPRTGCLPGALSPGEDRGSGRHLTGRGERVVRGAVRGGGDHAGAEPGRTGRSGPRGAGAGGVSFRAGCAGGGRPPVESRREHLLAEVAGYLLGGGAGVVAARGRPAGHPPGGATDGVGRDGILHRRGHGRSCDRSPRPHGGLGLRGGRTRRARPSGRGVRDPRLGGARSAAPAGVASDRPRVHASRRRDRLRGEVPAQPPLQLLREDGRVAARERIHHVHHQHQRAEDRPGSRPRADVGAGAVRTPLPDAQEPLTGERTGTP